MKEALDKNHFIKKQPFFQKIILKEFEKYLKLWISNNYFVIIISLKMVYPTKILLQLNKRIYLTHKVSVHLSKVINLTFSNSPTQQSKILQIFSKILNKYFVELDSFLTIFFTYLLSLFSRLFSPLFHTFIEINWI